MLQKNIFHSKHNLQFTCLYCDKTRVLLPALYCYLHMGRCFIYPVILIIDNTAVNIYLDLSIFWFWCAGLTETKAKPSSWGLAELGNKLSLVVAEDMW